MSSLSLADGPLTTDVAAASHGLDANTQQSKPPEAGLGAMAEPPAHAGLGASPDGLNMDATEPDPKKKKFNASEPQLTEFEQRMATALQTRDADKAEERKKQTKKRRTKKRKMKKGISRH